jgi:hypothetical protein
MLTRDIIRPSSEHLTLAMLTQVRIPLAPRVASGSLDSVANGFPITAQLFRGDLSVFVSRGLLWRGTTSLVMLGATDDPAVSFQQLTIDHELGVVLHKVRT